jgi:hypothetical protein
VRWAIASMRDGSALAVEETRIEQPIGSSSYDDVVAAESAAFGALSRRIAGKLAELAASP